MLYQIAANRSRKQKCHQYRAVPFWARRWGGDGYGGSADAQEMGTAPVPAAQAMAAYHRQFWAADIARWRPVIEAASAYAD